MYIFHPKGYFKVVVSCDGLNNHIYRTKFPCFPTLLQVFEVSFAKLMVDCGGFSNNLVHINKTPSTHDLASLVRLK